MPIVPKEKLISEKSELAVNARPDLSGYQTSVLEYRQPNKYRCEVKHEVERQGYQVPLVQTCIIHVSDECRQRKYDIHAFLDVGRILMVLSRNGNARSVEQRHCWGGDEEIAMFLGKTMLYFSFFLTFVQVAVALLLLRILMLEYII